MLQGARLVSISQPHNYKLTMINVLGKTGPMLNKSVWDRDDPVFYAVSAHRRIRADCLCMRPKVVL